MAKICLILSTNDFVRSFLNTKVMDEIASRHQLELIKCSSFKIDSDLIKIFKCVYEIDFENYPNAKNYHLFASALRWRNRHKSKTFIFRESREYIVVVAIKIKAIFSNFLKKKSQISNSSNLNNQFRKNSYFYKSSRRNIIGILIKASKSFIYLASYRLLSIKPFYLIAPKILGIDKIQCHELLRLIKENNYDLVLYPSSAYEVQIFDTIESSSVGGAKSFFIIDNWDNLSSKTVFLENPDAITVWGKQSAIHANKIHKIKKKNIFLLGSPKFDYYFKIKNNKFKKIFNFDYVLFLGVLQPYNEIAALKVIDIEISSNPKLYKNLKIVYRPHPGREYLINKAYGEKFKNIIFDPRMKNYVISRNKNFLVSNKNYYESLISNSLFMVGGLTTVVLESVIFNKKYLFLAYPEKYNLTDPKKMYENYTHYNEISKISYLSKCCHINDLSKDFRNLFRNYYQNKKNVISELSYFYDISKLGYSQKLYNITKKVLTN
jgi:hypothetical protein